jgi:hypothetical protein
MWKQGTFWQAMSLGHPRKKKAGTLYVDASGPLVIIPPSCGDLLRWDNSSLPIAPVFGPPPFIPFGAPPFIEPLFGAPLPELKITSALIRESTEIVPASKPPQLCPAAATLDRSKWLYFSVDAYYSLVESGLHVCSLGTGIGTQGSIRQP